MRLFADDAALRYGERTVLEYLAHVRAFLAWAEAQGLTLAGAEARGSAAPTRASSSRCGRSDGKPYSAGFQANRFSAVKSFFRFLTPRLLLLHDPIAGLERPRLETRLPRTILTRAEARKLVEAPGDADAARAARPRDPRDALRDRHSRERADPALALRRRHRGRHAARRARQGRQGPERAADARRGRRDRGYLANGRPQLLAATRTGSGVYPAKARSGSSSRRAAASSTARRSTS